MDEEWQNRLDYYSGTIAKLINDGSAIANEDNELEIYCKNKETGEVVKVIKLDDRMRAVLVDRIQDDLDDIKFKLL